MTELQNYILETYLPGYADIVYQIERFSDYELNLVNEHLPDCIDELQDAICIELQWVIVGDLCGPFINDWDNFLFKYEGEIMDYFWNGNSFIGYNDNNHSYEISKQTIIEVCSELVSEAEEEYTLNEEVDFSKVIANLNKYYPVKFCEAQ